MYRSKVAEMAKLAAFVCLAVVAMDGTAGFLGFKAEIAQNRVKKHTRQWTSACKEASHGVFKLGFAAAALLALAHIIANLLGGCICISFAEELESSPISRQLSFACLIFSWITMAVGFPFLLRGMLENSKSKSCLIAHHHFLSIGGMLCFLHALFCAAHYICATIGIGRGNTNGGGACP